MTTKLPEEVIKVHENSLLLLDKSNEQLKDVQEMLRKAIVRLSIAARRDDEQLDEVLEKLKSSVKEDIDLQQLDMHLDRLLVCINHAESNGKLSSGMGFYAYLKDSIEELDLSLLADSYKSRIKSLVGSKPSDKDMSVQLLALIREIVINKGDGDGSDECNTSDDFTRVKSFADDIIESLKLETIVKEDIGVSVILDELADDIIKHVDKISSGVSVAQGKAASVDEKSAENIKHILIELLNNLVLPENIQKERDAVTRKLDCPIEGAEQWKVVVKDLSALINMSIKVLQHEKDELQVFIKKTTSQLEEIEEYVRRSRQERIDTASESSMLKDSVDANVEKIQTTVGDEGDLNQLKNVVQVHLTEIRKSVEEHQAAEVERENISKQGYAHIIGELARTQKETMMLKEQLEESRKKMLRDPLTGLPNRLAYEERIILEINRNKRNSENICIAMWDIDHFKKVNDTYGHEAGDRVLKLLSKIISTRVRKVDMFARIGGEEFVLLMPDTKLENALGLNEELRNSLADSGFHYDGSPCLITASVGIARIEEYDNPESVMRKADEALYKSKREGRNRCTIFTSED